MKKKALISNFPSFCIVLICFLLFDFFSTVFLYRKINIDVNIDFWSINSLQTTISLLSITIMELVFNDIDFRIMGMSYKFIFFNNRIFYIFNITYCLFYMIIAFIINICMTLLVSVPALSKYDSFIYTFETQILLLSTLLCLRMIYLAIVAKHKKSQVYYQIYKILEKKINTPSDFSRFKHINLFMRKLRFLNRFKFENAYKRIIDWLEDIDTPSENHESIHNQYIEEEIYLLFFLLKNLEKLENNPSIIEEIKNKIRNKMNYIIISDKRDNKYLGTMLKKYFINNELNDYCEEICYYCSNIDSN